MVWTLTADPLLSLCSRPPFPGSAVEGRDAATVITATIIAAVVSAAGVVLAAYINRPRHHDQDHGTKP